MAMRFDAVKATQLVARLLLHSGGAQNVLKLVKLVYLTDRRALVEGGRLITQDRLVSMPHGPVNSAILNLINDEQDPGERGIWHRHVSERKEHEVSLIADPGTSALSSFEMAIIDHVFADFGHLDKFVLRDLTHDLPEWCDPQGGSTPIHIHQILENEGFSEDEAREIEQNMEHESFVLHTLGADN